MSDTQASNELIAVHQKTFVDLVNESITFVDSIGKVDALKAAQALEQNFESQGFALGGVLRRIRDEGATDKGWYAGHATFDEYIETEHHIKLGTARGLIALYTTITGKMIDWSVVAPLGISKAMALARVMTKENAAQQVKMVIEQNLTYKQIKLLPEVAAAKSPAKVSAGKQGGHKKAAKHPPKAKPAPSPAPAAAPISKGKPLPETTAPIPESMAANFLTSKTSDEAIEWVKALLPKAWAKAVAQAAPAKETPEVSPALEAFEVTYPEVQKTYTDMQGVPAVVKALTNMVKRENGYMAVLCVFGDLFPNVDLKVIGIKTGAAE
jgi:hypothetical protein